ncbi:hypothetical protein RND71_035124 [Anisodus tanguticus]|uniref:Cyanobacterial aminoacyl-tRNA synthetase CAAD domain-containing protein n=1 Tax=Anisodus tanguticus TaxID=243964 RepID=A0AAE1UU72_9SOLA|nr:hypothetical protein RND71_035124 [Anisodus tanguticus]
MARDVLNIQASSICVESAFSRSRYQIGDYRHSLVGDDLEIAYYSRDWIRAERRRCGQPEINEEDDENYNEILTEGSGSDVDQFDQQIPIPTEEPHEIIKQLEQSPKGHHFSRLKPLHLKKLLLILWNAVEDKSTVLLYGGGTIIAIWLSSIVVGAINSVPLVMSSSRGNNLLQKCELPKVLELVGLGYTGWFVYGYLLFKEANHRAPPHPNRARPPRMVKKWQKNEQRYGEGTSLGKQVQQVASKAVVANTTQVDEAPITKNTNDPPQGPDEWTVVKGKSVAKPANVVPVD